VLSCAISDQPILHMQSAILCMLCCACCAVPAVLCMTTVERCRHKALQQMERIAVGSDCHARFTIAWDSDTPFEPTVGACVLSALKHEIDRVVCKAVCACHRLRTRLFAGKCILELAKDVGPDVRHFDLEAAHASPGDQCTGTTG
jgi:hypothetical protein